MNDPNLRKQLNVLSTVIQQLSQTVSGLQQEMEKDFESSSEDLSDDLSVHQNPLQGAECAAYLIDIDENNYCEYQSSSGVWYPCIYCDEVVKEMICRQFEDYKENVEKSTCKSQMRRLMGSGPPVYLRDGGMPVPQGEYIARIWFCKTNCCCCAKLLGALEGKERQDLWDHYKEFFKLLPEEDD